MCAFFKLIKENVTHNRLLLIILIIFLVGVKLINSVFVTSKLFMQIYPYFLFFNMLNILFFLFVNRSSFVDFFKKTKNITWIILVVLIICGIFFRLMMSQGPLSVLETEGYYKYVAKNLATGNVAEYESHPVGYPAVLKFFFLIF